MANESPIALYDALRRTKRRKLVVSLSSSEEDSDGDKTPVPSRQTRKQAGKETVESSSKEHIRETFDQDDHFSKEINRELDNDIVLQKTRALIDKVASSRNGLKNRLDGAAVSSLRDEIIVIDLANEDEKQTDILHSTKHTNSSTRSAASSLDITLEVHSNENRIDYVTIPKLATSLNALYATYGGLHGLLDEELEFTFKGIELSVEQSPSMLNMRSGDVVKAVIRAKPFKQGSNKRHVHLWVSVNGASDEEFHIQADLPLKSLQGTICEKHNILNRESIVMVIDGAVLDMSESAEFYGLMNEDRINVVLKDFSDPGAVTIQLRFQNGDIESASIVPINKVTTLIQQITKKKSCKTTTFALRIDGETMHGDRCFLDYDIEGGELIEVCTI